MCAQTAAGCVQQTLPGAVVYAAAAEVSTGHPDMRGDAGKLLAHNLYMYNNACFVNCTSDTRT